MGRKPDNEKSPARILPPPPTPEGLLRALARLGLTNEEIAEVFGLTDSQFQALLADNPDLDAILHEAKSIPNRRVEASLYKRALGYQTREVVHTAGKPTRVTIKEVPPDVVAAIFWLKNRDPKRWRDTLEVSHTLRDRFDRAHRAMSSGWMLESAGTGAAAGDGGGDRSGERELES